MVQKLSDLKKPFKVIEFIFKLIYKIIYNTKKILRKLRIRAPLANAKKVGTRLCSLKFH